VAACAAAPGLEGFEVAEISVGDSELTVAIADTSAQRRQGLRGVERLPDGIDGMLFVWDSPTSATFAMTDTLLPLDIWWFDEEGRLVGSTVMETCLKGPCVGYGSPGPIMWAMETPTGEYGFIPGALLSTVENP